MSLRQLNKNKYSVNFPTCQGLSYYPYFRGGVDQSHWLSKHTITSIKLNQTRFKQQERFAPQKFNTFTLHSI